MGLLNKNGKRELTWAKCERYSQSQQQLRQWYQRQPGSWLQKDEESMLEGVIADLFGYHILQIGVPSDTDSLQVSRIPHRVAMDVDFVGLQQKQDKQQKPLDKLIAEPEYVPVSSDSVDVLILWHTLEFCINPHEVLRETERVLIPEGHVVILGFNPLGPWMLWRMALGWRRRAPWCGRFVGISRLKDWLQLLGFEITESRHYFFRPPLRHAKLMNKLKFLDKFGKRLWPIFGGAYMLVAKKRVATLTPIKPRWRPRRSRMVTADLAGNSRITNRNSCQKKP
jgi:SAM-dependent methyltransferase